MLSASKISSYLKENLEIWLIIFFVFSLFFPIRKVFFAPLSFTTGAYSDFTSISLYLSDILIISLVVLNFWFKKAKFSPSRLVYLLFIAVFVNFFTHGGSYFPLLAFFSLKFLELLVLHETFKLSSNRLVNVFVWCFGLFSGLASILATVQFVLKRSVGGPLHFLGESVLSPSILGVAKIDLAGDKLVRGYATFPHPNLLAAYLLCGIVFCIFLYLKYKSHNVRFLAAFLSLLIIPGFLLTFSRAAYIGLAFSFTCFLAITFYYKRNLRKPAFAIAIAVIVTFTALIMQLRPLFVTRATYNDSATKERIFYDKVGLSMIKDNPVLGVGLGTSVLHMQQYTGIKLQPWEIQPIHNYFLIAIAEMGIPLGLLLIFFLIQNAGKLSLLIHREGENDRLLYRAMLLSIICGFLILMLFDHYFYTIQQTQLLLWIVLGLISAEFYTFKTKQPS